MKYADSLVDPYQRKINYMRLSLTDRCNLRCIYCMPAHGVKAIQRASVEKTPAALLSRAVVGIRNTTLIQNVPGSPGAAQENLAAVWDAIPHAVDKIPGDTRDCAM
jgi:uncharacterized Fe-S radical SAM superfamily protein PflX